MISLLTWDTSLTSKQHGTCPLFLLPLKPHITIWDNLSSLHTSMQPLCRMHCITQIERDVWVSTRMFKHCLLDMCEFYRELRHTGKVAWHKEEFNAGVFFFLSSIRKHVWVLKILCTDVSVVNDQVGYHNNLIKLIKGALHLPTLATFNI